MRKFNPEVPAEYFLQALAAITSPTSIDAITENYRMHGISWTGSEGQLPRQRGAGTDSHHPAGQR